MRPPPQSQKAQGEFCWALDGLTEHPARLVSPRKEIIMNEQSMLPTTEVEIEWVNSGFRVWKSWKEIRIDDIVNDLNNEEDDSLPKTRRSTRRVTKPVSTVTTTSPTKVKVTSPKKQSTSKNAKKKKTPPSPVATKGKKVLGESPTEEIEAKSSEKGNMELKPTAGKLSPKKCVTAVRSPQKQSPDKKQNRERSPSPVKVSANKKSLTAEDSTPKNGRKETKPTPEKRTAKRAASGEVRSPQNQSTSKQKKRSRSPSPGAAKARIVTESREKLKNAEKEGAAEAIQIGGAIVASRIQQTSEVVVPPSAKRQKGFDGKKIPVNHNQSFIEAISQPLISAKDKVVSGIMDLFKGFQQGSK